LLSVPLLRTLNAIGLEHFRAPAKFTWTAPSLSCLSRFPSPLDFFVGLFPLAGISNIGISDALHEDSRNRHHREKITNVRQLLVAAQIGFAFALLVGAGCCWPAFACSRRSIQGLTPTAWSALRRPAALQIPQAEVLRTS